MNFLVTRSSDNAMCVIGMVGEIASGKCCFQDMFFSTEAEITLCVSSEEWEICIVGTVGYVCLRKGRKCVSPERWDICLWSIAPNATLLAVAVEDSSVNTLSGGLRETSYEFDFLPASSLILKCLSLSHFPEISRQAQESKFHI